MSEINTGGPAFPSGWPENEFMPVETGNPVERGLNIRDYFAAKALAALINHPNKDGENCGKQAVPKLAKWAYEYADAMLEARES